MLAKLADRLPEGEGWLHEPKGDGSRALVFRDGAELYIQSRELNPRNRYFPELLAPLAQQLPQRCVLDGEIVTAGPEGLDFDALLLRIHPAASRIQLLAAQTPASYVAFDLLALDEEDLRAAPQSARREKLERALASLQPPLYLTPASRDRAVAQDWFSRFEGAGLECVVAGFRWHKNGPGTMVGSLLLGLYDSSGVLHHVGVTSSFTAAKRRELVQELEPLRAGATENHPWREWASFAEEHQRMPGMTSRWNRGKDLSWEPLRPERVCEVAYDHLQNDRFRHATTFVRWRPDKKADTCRYDQREAPPPAELQTIFGAH